MKNKMVNSKYDIKYSMISNDGTRFCSCRRTIEGENFEKAAQNFSEELKKDGLYLTFICRYKLTWVNLNEKNKSCILSKEFDDAVKQICKYNYLDYLTIEKELRSNSIESCKMLDKYKK